MAATMRVEALAVGHRRQVPGQSIPHPQQAQVAEALERALVAVLRPQAVRVEELPVAVRRQVVPQVLGLRQGRSGSPPLPGQRSPRVQPRPARSSAVRSEAPPRGMRGQHPKPRRRHRHRIGQHRHQLRQLRRFRVGAAPHRHHRPPHRRSPKSRPRALREEVNTTPIGGGARDAWSESDLTGNRSHTATALLFREGFVPDRRIRISD